MLVASCFLATMKFGVFADYHKKSDFFKELLISQCMCTLYTEVLFLSNLFSDDRG